jgi:hypothetical protein
MTRKKKTIFFLLLILFALANNNSLMAMNIVNTMWPYDTSIRPTFNKARRWQTAFYGEGSFHNAIAFNDEGRVLNPLRIWNCEQNALAMLEGFPTDSVVGQFRSALLDSDNGIRGRFLLDGDLQLNFGGALAANLYFANDWRIGIYLPFNKMSLRNVRFIDQTPNIDNLDKLVHELLTDNIAQNVWQLGHLDIGCWQRSGIGDLTLLLEWFRDFQQYKPFLKNVRVNWRWGIGFPTGLRENEDLIFAVPFGYDGAVSMPFGLGLDLRLGTNFQCGVDVQLTQIFGHTKQRRIKTDVHQTELLLLEKTCVFKDSGLVQRFNLYFQFYRFLQGLSFKVTYQYLKQGDAQYSLKTQHFSSNIANTSPRLDDFTMHHMIPEFTYDFACHWPKEKVRPELNLYFRIPFNGKNVSLFPIVGGILSLDF